MPDAATMGAATPKCPVEPGRPEWPGVTVPCRQRLSYDDASGMWVCREHGHVTTIQSLVHRQGATDDA